VFAEITPPWVGFTTPRAIIVGKDQFLYVADYDANEVIMLDQGGKVWKQRHILHPMALAQNSRLDLYVSGETIDANGDTLGAIYRISLARLDTTKVTGYDTLNGGTLIVPITVPDTIFYNNDLANAPMRLAYSDPANPDRRFTGIGFLPDDEYLVTRDGSNNASFVDPDCRLLRFNKGDTLETPVADVNTTPSGGTGITDILHLTSIYIFPSLYDFIITQSSEGGIAFGAIWMTYTNAGGFQGWAPEFDPSNPIQRTVEFISPFRYEDAVSVSYDTKRREIYILDAALDSVSVFTQAGFFESQSFGVTLTKQNGLPGLNHPMSLAFSTGYCTLYIADTQNHLIRRFILSSETNCN
jgi:hypothetical protein